MKRIFHSLLLAVLLVANVQAADYLYRGVRPAVVIDVRTPEEFAAGHVDGAINLPYDQISAASVGKLDKKADVLLYCRSGRRSAIARDTLQKLGFAKVHDAGGLQSVQAELKRCTAATC